MIQPTKQAWQPLLDRKLPVLLHLLAWGIYAAMVFYGNFARMSPRFFFVHYCLAFCMHAGSFYFNYAYLVPKVLPRHSLACFLGINLLAAVVMTATIIVLEVVLLTQVNLVPQISRGDLLPLLTRISNYVIFAVFGLFIKLSVDWYRKLRKDKELENEHLKSELALLKAQINPHFLFNSLNNLYALSLRQAPETPVVILRISEMMRYLLYEANAELVALEKEVDMTRTFVDMHEMGSKLGYKIEFEASGTLAGVMIQPLLILPLIENVFKHGTLPITISIRLEGNALRVHTENTMRAAGPEIPGGIGISNLRRRLELLYPEAHHLKLQQAKDSFIADMSIQLTSFHQ